MLKPAEFSVVIPLYNKERHIDRAITSVLNQTYSNFELIVVNDGSTDSSLEAIANKRSSYRLVNQSNAGESAARNTGIKISKNSYIAFLDADDEWDKDFLSTLNESITLKPYKKIFCTNYRKKTGSKVQVAQKFPPGKTIELDYFEHSRKGNSLISSSSVCIHKDLLTKAGLFPEKIHLYPDLYLWSKISISESIVFYTSPKATYHRDADNRICNAVTPTTQDTPFEKVIIEAIKTEELANSRKYFALEFLAHYKLLNAFKASTQNRSFEAKKILSNTFPVTKAQSIRKWTILLMSLFPDRVINKLWRVIAKK